MNYILINKMYIYKYIFLWPLVFISQEVYWTSHNRWPSLEAFFRLVKWLCQVYITPRIVFLTFYPLIQRGVYESKKKVKIQKCMASNHKMCYLKWWFKEDHKPNEVLELEMFYRWWFKAHCQLWNFAWSSSWKNSESR